MNEKAKVESAKAIKIAIVGLPGVGKTSILCRICNFNLPTYKHYRAKIEPLEKIDFTWLGISVQILDLEQSESLGQEYLMDTDILIYVIDISQLDTYDAAIADIKKHVDILSRLNNKKVQCYIFLHKFDDHSGEDLINQTKNTKRIQKLAEEQFHLKKYAIKSYKTCINSVHMNIVFNDILLLRFPHIHMHITRIINSLENLIDDPSTSIFLFDDRGWIVASNFKEYSWLTKDSWYMHSIHSHLTSVEVSWIESARTIGRLPNPLENLSFTITRTPAHVYALYSVPKISLMLKVNIQSANKVPYELLEHFAEDFFEYGNLLEHFHEIRDDFDFKHLKVYSNESESETKPEPET